jgi:predicted nucleic acid-binding protein
MDVYFDSAIIVKLYVQEPNSPGAIEIVAGYSAPYLLTQWQLLEIKNAIRLKAFRGEITATEMSQSISAFDQDVANGRWHRPPYDVPAIEHKTEELSANHALTLGCRTLDVIHVAAALALSVKDFVTLDARQAALARQVGLTVKP